MARGDRQPGFLMTDAHRVKIQNSNILNALIEHATGVRDMSNTQVTAAIALLRKVLPDLNAVTHSGDAENPIVHRMEQDAERFTSRIAGLAARNGQDSGDKRSVN